MQWTASNHEVASKAGCAAVLSGHRLEFICDRCTPVTYLEIIFLLHHVYTSLNNTGADHCKHQKLTRPSPLPIPIQQPRPSLQDSGFGESGFGESGFGESGESA